MGCKVELNTLIGVPVDFDTSLLEVGGVYTILKSLQRAFPIGIAMLIVDKDWNFYGYGVAKQAIVGSEQTQIEFEMLTKFDIQTGEMYKQNFMEAAKLTGEVK